MAKGPPTKEESEPHEFIVSDGKLGLKGRKLYKGREGMESPITGVLTTWSLERRVGHAPVLYTDQLTTHVL